jgi:hypothetical protein
MLLAMEMPAAGHRQMRAWWMRNHQIPSVAQHLLDWLLQVPLRIAFAWQQVAAKSKMPATPKGITDTGAVFAGNKNAQWSEGCGVGSHGSLASLGGGNHGGLKLDLLCGHFGAGCASGGKESILGGFLGGLELKHGLKGHGSLV